MALAPGVRLGPYEVTAQIGVGGMGEVYRATDTNLARQVAIKVLPEAVGRDALLDWCKEHGLMGIVPHQAALMAL